MFSRNDTDTCNIRIVYSECIIDVYFDLMETVSFLIYSKLVKLPGFIA